MAKYNDNTLIKTSFLDYEWDRCTGISACCRERPKNGKYTPRLSSAGNAQKPALNPSALLGIILADLIHSILL